MSPATREEIVALVAAVSGRPPAQVRPEAELVADLGIDSPKALQLLVELEERLDVELDDDVLAEVHTVADVLALVERLERGAR